MSGGRVGMSLLNASVKGVPGTEYHMGGRAVVYDIESGKYTVLGFSGTQFHNGNNFIFSTGDYSQRYFIYATPYKDSWKYEAIYGPTGPFNTIPAINDKWIFMNITNKDETEYTILYSKIGEWKWHKLGDEQIQSIDIAGERVVFNDAKANVYLCDLTKLPDSLDKCAKIHREDEPGSGSIFDKENSNRVLYNSTKKADKKFIIDLSKQPFTYEEIILPKVSEEATGKKKSPPGRHIPLQTLMKWADLAEGKRKRGLMGEG